MSLETRIILWAIGVHGVITICVFIIVFSRLVLARASRGRWQSMIQLNTGRSETGPDCLSAPFVVPRIEPIVLPRHACIYEIHLVGAWYGFLPAIHIWWKGDPYYAVLPYSFLGGHADYGDLSSTRLVFAKPIRPDFTHDQSVLEVEFRTTDTDGQERVLKNTITWGR